MSSYSKVVIVGGGLAGLYTTYWLLKEGLESNEVTLISEEWPPYSRHRLVYALHRGGLRNLSIGVVNYVLGKGVKVLKGWRATRIDLSNNEVVTEGPNGERVIRYDYLIICTGGKPIKPPINGLDGKVNVSTYHSLGDLMKLKRLPKGREVAIVGGGAIGVSLAYTLIKLGYRVSLIEIKDHLLPTLLDRRLAKVIEDYLRGLGVRIYTGTVVNEVIGGRFVTSLRTSEGKVRCDYLVLATGVKPNTDLLLNTEVKLRDGAVVIDDYGRVMGFDNVFALGDCALSKDYVSREWIYRPLGFVAGEYAKVVAKNVVGGGIKSLGVIPTIYEGLGDYSIYVVGLAPSEANRLGINYEVVIKEAGNEVQAILKSGSKVIGWQQVSPHYPGGINRAYEYFRMIRSALG